MRTRAPRTRFKPYDGCRYAAGATMKGAQGWRPLLLPLRASTLAYRVCHARSVVTVARRGTVNFSQEHTA